MRVGRRWAVVGAAVAAATALAACGGDDSAGAAQALRRQVAGGGLALKGVPADGSLVGNVVKLDLSGAGLEIVKPNGDLSAKTGHYVVFADSTPVAFGARIPGGRGVVETADSSVTLAGFTAGAHKVWLVLADGAHRRIGTKAAEAGFTVAGPTLRASTLARSPANQPVIVSVAVQDVGVAPPDGSAAGGTGHFDLFVDRDPTAAGAPVPTERGILHTAEQTIAVPDLGSGGHQIWVVLVNGDETPLDPMVADKVLVQVG